MKITTKALLNALLSVLTLLPHLSYSQYCDSITPTMNVDLSASPNVVWTSPMIARDGNCCGTTAPDNCLEFIIMLHPNAIAVSFSIAAGAVPPGALFYQIDCGPPTPVGSPICLDGPGPHHLTFCKPGNNNNAFSIVSYSEPIVGSDITLNAGCQGLIYAQYYNEPSISWTSIGPGNQGDYDSYLSCTTGCDTTFVTAPPTGAPAFVDYLVCGNDIGDCNPNPICDTIRVNFVDPIQVDITPPISEICAGDPPVLLTANITGGTGPFTYLWSNGATTSTTSETGGTHSVTVTDQGGCISATNSAVINENPLPIVDAGPDQAVCDGISVTLNGSGAVNYVWDNGVSDGVSFTQTVGTTTYSVTGTDANGCVNNDQVNVTVNPLPVVDAGPNQTVCNGTTTTLNGSGAVNYVWDNGVTDGVNFTPPLGTTTYSVVGTDANGCSSTDQVDVLVNPLPLVDAGADQTVCEGTMVVLNGSGASSYAWDNGVTNGVGFIPPVGTTTYTVTGTDANGCINTDQVNVTVNPLPVIDAGVDQVVCEGVSVTLNGAGGVSYAWDNGVTDGVSFIQAVGTTTYTVTGTDANGCVNTDQVNVTVNPLPVVDAGPNQTVCNGTTTTLNGSGAVNYVWDNGVTDGVNFTPPLGTTTYSVVGTDANGCSNTDQVDVLVNPLPLVDTGADQTVCEGATVTLNGSGAVSYVWDNGVTNGVGFVPNVGTTTYTVTGTDANGCVNTDQVNVTVNPLPVIDAGADQVVCDGVSVTLNGAGGVSYAWDNGVTDGVSFIQAVGTTTYTVTGTDANGCVNTDQVNVTVNPLPTVDAGPNQTVCNGANVTLNGSGAVNYVWDNGVNNGVSFTPLGTTTYSVVGTDANGCSNTDQVDVLVNPLPSVDAGADQTVCEGTTVVLNGSGASSYAWDNGVTNGVGFVPNVGTTTYTVTGTDANGCVNTDQVNVTVNPLPVIDAGADQVVCEGVSVTLNGAGGVSYAWDNGVTDGVSFIQAVGTTTYTVTGTDANGCVNTDQVNVTVNPLPIVDAGADEVVCDGVSVTLSGSGAVGYIWDNGVVDGVTFTPTVGTTTYTVVGTDANGCSNTDQVDVLVNALPIVDAGPDHVICSGDVVTLNGSGAVSYVWNNGVNDGVSFTPPAGVTQYTVTGTDANGCSNTDQLEVFVNQLPEVEAGPDQVVCDGVSVTLTASGAVAYVWDNGVSDGVGFVPPLGTNTYTVTGTDGNGCSNMDQLDVTANPLPVVDAGPDQTVCEDSPITLFYNGTANVMWNNNVVNNVPFNQPVGSVIYTVIDSLPNGCWSSDQAMVTVNPNPAVSANDDEICEGEGVVLSGQGALSYTWTGGVIDGEEFFPSTTSAYEVTGTNGFGCSSTAISNVIVHPAPIVDFNILDMSLSTTSSGTGFDNLSSGAVDYEWTFGDGTGVNYDFEPYHEFPTDDAGSYEIILTATSDQGCVAEKIKYVYVTLDYTIYVPNAFTPDANGVNEVFKPVMDGFDENDYVLYIYNRWGELVFESHDMNVGWDGEYSQYDKKVQDGVFTWKIEAKIKNSSDTKIFVGHASVLK